MTTLALQPPLHVKNHFLLLLDKRLMYRREHMTYLGRKLKEKCLCATITTTTKETTYIYKFLQKTSHCSLH